MSFLECQAKTTGNITFVKEPGSKGNLSLCSGRSPNYLFKVQPFKTKGYLRDLGRDRIFPGLCPKTMD